MEEFYWSQFFNPICDVQKSDGNPTTSSYFDHGDHWVNIRRVIDDAGTSFNVRTSSSFHPFNQFDSTNAYSGWDSTNQNEYSCVVCQNLDASIESSLEMLVGDSYPNNQSEYYSTTEVQLTSNLVPLCNQICDASPREYSSTSLSDHFDSYTASIANLEGHHNLRYVADHLKSGGFLGSSCVKQTCGSGETEPKLQDTSCSFSHVPLCSMPNPLAYRVVLQWRYNNVPNWPSFDKKIPPGGSGVSVRTEMTGELEVTARVLAESVPMIFGTRALLKRALVPNAWRTHRVLSTLKSTR